ncbi:MAG: sigma-70 family RNA polymerase sigma factor [Sedimentisphaerales bacterium]|nr:sigma-70 family RNA polymerase sigma factor [Sedimentisphaerales bacterium]
MQTCDWQTIVTEHGPLVWKAAYRLLANRDDAADCYQETFLAAFELAQRQRVRNMAALLTRLATMRAIDRIRRRRRRKQREMDAADWQDMPSGAPGPSRRSQNLELAEQLTASLSQLPEQEANVFCLRYLHDMSYREIARQLNIKSATAGVLLHRARAKLRQMLAPADSEKDEVFS